MPDKAIDVMDEAGARVHLKAMTKPPDLRELEEEIRKLDKEKEEAVANQDFERAASFRDTVMRQKRKREAIHHEWRESTKEAEGLVDIDVICETVSNMTGIPLTRLEKSEAQRTVEDGGNPQTKRGQPGRSDQRHCQGRSGVVGPD